MSRKVSSIHHHHTHHPQFIIIGTMLLLIAIGYALGTSIPEFLRAHVQTDAMFDSPIATGGSALVNPPHQLQNFTLTSHSGEAIQLRDLRGKVVLLFFGYTNCPDICPTTLADYKLVKQALGTAADEVVFAFITVDSYRDTPAVLTRYLGQFDPVFIGMTGDEKVLERLSREYGLYFEQDNINVQHAHDPRHRHDPNNDANYFVQHTSPSYLIDRDGFLQRVIFYGTDVDTITTNIRELLDLSGSSA